MSVNTEPVETAQARCIRIELARIVGQGHRPPHIWCSISCVCETCLARDALTDILLWACPTVPLVAA